MPRLWILYGLIFFGILFAGGIAVIRDLKEELRLKETENRGLQSVLLDSLRVERSKTGETVATQPKIEVSKATFEAVTSADLKSLERKFDQKFNRVYEKSDLVLSTVTNLKAPIHDTILISPKKDTTRAKVIHFKSAWKNEKVLLVGDSAYSTDTARTKVVRLAVKGKRSKKFLFIRYGPRKEEYKTLIFNPDTRIDTLTNFSIIQ